MKLAEIMVTAPNKRSREDEVRRLYYFEVYGACCTSQASNNVEFRSECFSSIGALQKRLVGIIRNRNQFGSAALNSFDKALKKRFRAVTHSAADQESSDQEDDTEDVDIGEGRGEDEVRFWLDHLFQHGQVAFCRDCDCGKLLMLRHTLDNISIDHVQSRVKSVFQAQPSYKGDAGGV